MREMIIYSQRLAGYLMMQGFKLLRIEPNKEFSSFNVFIFEDSLELRLKMNEYSNKKSKSLQVS